MFVIDDLIYLGIGIAMAGCGIAIYEHWDELTSFVKRWVEITLDIFKTTARATFKAIKVFIEVVKDGLAKIVCKRYIEKNNGKIHEEEEAAEIDPSELPPDLKEKYYAAKRRNTRIDATSEVEKVMSLTLSGR